MFLWIGKLTFESGIWGHAAHALDSMVSVTHGRPAMISQEMATEVPLPLCTQDTTMRLSFFAKSIELYEIINRITLAVYSNATTKRYKKGPSDSPPEGADEDLATIMELDQALANWEKRLPDHLSMEFLYIFEDEIIKRQAVILRIRLAPSPFPWTYSHTNTPQRPPGPPPPPPTTPIPLLPRATTRTSHTHPP